jgi:putative hemolysin
MIFAASEPVSMTISLLLIPVLVVLNGFFVAAEFAIVAIRLTRVEELVNQNVPRSQALLKAVRELDNSVAACQLGITIASLALGLVSEPALHSLLHPLFEKLPDSMQGAFSRTLSIMLTLSLVTFMHVVFGELMPKTMALQSSERVGLLVAGPLNFFARRTQWIINLMNGSSNRFLRWCGFAPAIDDGEIYSVEELRLLIEDTEEAGLLDQEQAEVVRNVFALSNKTVRDCMVPWEKVLALDVTTPEAEILEKVRQGAHTRMPVYDGTPDNVVGVVNTKDLFYLFSLKGVVALIDAIYEPVEISASATVSDALKRFKTGHRHLAVVKEADGRVVGILTLEDVLEEIVGDIEDEHDKPVPKLRKSTFQKLLNRRRIAKLRGPQS